MFWYKFVKDLKRNLEGLKSIAAENQNNKIVQGNVSQKAGQVGLLLRAVPQKRYWFLTVRQVKKKFVKEHFNDKHSVCFKKQSVLDLFDYQKNNSMKIFKDKIN